MSEHLKISDLDLTWQVGKITLNLAHHDIELTTENSTFWTYRQTPMLDHIVYQAETGNYRRIFIDPHTREDTFMQLAGAGITQVTCDSPSTELLAQFWEIEMDDLDAELDYYEEYGELPEYGQ